jgi:D-xylose reductase
MPSVGFGCWKVSK